MWRENGKREVQQHRLDGFSWSAHLCKRIIWFTRQSVAARGNSGVVEGKRLIGQKSVVISFINATMLFLHCVPAVNISALFMCLLVNFMSLVKPTKCAYRTPDYIQTWFTIHDTHGDWSHARLPLYTCKHTWIKQVRVKAADCCIIRVDEKSNWQRGKTQRLTPAMTHFHTQPQHK